MDTNRTSIRVDKERKMMLFGNNKSITTRSFDFNVYSGSIKGSATKEVYGIFLRFRIIFKNYKSDFLELKINKDNLDSKEVIDIITEEYSHMFI